MTLLDRELTGLHISLVVEYYDQVCPRPVHRVHGGLNELIPQELISAFDERELEHLICGIPESMYPFLPTCQTNSFTPPYS